MQPKQAVFDRIEQSFLLLKTHFISIFTPIFLFHLLSVTVFGTLMSVYFFGLVNVDNVSGNPKELFMGLWTDTSFIIFISAGIMSFLFTSLIGIIFFLGTVKSIDQAYKGEEITSKENIMYGIKNFGNSMSIYWYIFKYVALIPSLIFIIGGILNIYGFSTSQDIIIKTGFAIEIFSAVLFLIFSLYRGVKIKFAFFNAISRENYSKKTFIQSLDITDSMWWRIVGNFIFISFILSFIIGFIGNIIGMIFFSVGSNLSLDSFSMNMSEEQIKQIVIDTFKNYTQFHVLDLVKSAIDTFLSTFGVVYMFVFTYLFYKTLDYESSKREYNLTTRLIEHEVKHEL